MENPSSEKEASRTVESAKTGGRWLTYLLVAAIAAVVAFSGFTVIQGYLLPTIMNGHAINHNSAQKYYQPIVLLDENAVFRSVTMHVNVTAGSVKTISLAISRGIDSTVSQYTKHGSVVFLSTKDVMVPTKDNITRKVTKEILDGNFGKL